ncbi:MAG: GAF domain-containing protein [Anaerolineae bacterium]
MDTEHRVAEWNPGAEKLFGYASSEAMGCDLDALIASLGDEVLKEAADLTRRVFGGETVHQAECIRYRKDGTSVDVILAAAPILIEGEFAGAVTSYTDITERKRVERTLRRRTKQLEAVRDVGLDIVGELNLDELLRSIVARAIELVDGTAGGFDLYQPERDVLEFCIHIGYDELPARTTLSAGEGLAGKIWQTGETIVVDDYAGWGGRSAAWADHVGHCADMGVPVQWGDEFLGVLEVKADSPRVFSREDARLLELFATQAAIAIRNARMYEDSRRRLRETSSLLEVSRDLVSILDLDAVLERVIEAAIEATEPAEKGALHLLDEGRDELVVRASVGFRPKAVEASRFAPGEGYVGWAFSHQQPVIIDDVSADPQTRGIELGELHGEKSAFAVPLVFGHKAMGTLTLYNVTRAGVFDQTHLDLLSIFASQAATAIRNARLHEQTERRTSQLRAVNHVAHRANLALHLDDLVEAVYEEVGALFEADAFFLALYDREEDELDFRLSVDEGIREPRSRRPLRPGLTASVVTEGKPLLIEDYDREQDDLPPAETWGTEKVSRSWLGVPMRAGGQVTGVISVQAYAPFAYGDEDEQLLVTIADQVAMALEKTRLYEESQRRARQAALLSEAGRHVSSELEPDVLLDTIVSAVRDSFDYHNVILLLLDNQGTPSSGDGRLRMQSIAGAYVDLLPGDLSLAVGEGMTGHAAATGQTQLSNDVSRNPHYVRKATEHTRSELAVPIKSGDRVIGVLDLQDDEYDAFDDLDVTTLETLGTQIAAAIENARLFQAERERSAQLATVSRVAESITSVLDLDDVLRRTVEMITEAFGYYYASIMLIDEERGDLVFKAGAGGFAGETPSGFRQAINEGMIGCVARRGESLLANDVSQDPRYIPAYLTETKSELDVPLKYRDKVIGVLDLQSEELDGFTEHDVMAMEALAGHIAAAIENARLFEVARQRVAELRAVREASLQLTSALELEPVLETILEGALNLASAEDAHIFLYDEETLFFGAAMWDGERQDEPIDTIRPHGLTYSVARSGERIVVADAMRHKIFENRRWEGAIVGMPLTIGDEVQGVMNIAYQEPHDFTDQELWVLDLLADQAAIAIRNARLYDETRDRALEQETLREAALALTTALDRDEVVERVLAQLQRVVPYDTASVLLARGDRVDIVGGRGFSDLSGIVGLSFPLDEDHPNRDVIRAGKPVILEDAPQVYEAFRREPHTAAAIRSWLGVPMVVGDRTIGMIALDKRTPGFYTDAHAKLAEAFAAQAGIAIENAQLHQETVRQLAETEVLREMMLSAASTLDFDEVLARTIEVLERAMGIEYLAFVIPEVGRDSGETFMVSHPCLLGYVPPEGGYRFPIDACLTGQVYTTGEPQVVHDVRQAGFYAAAATDVRSELAVPVKVSDEVAAVLNLESSRPDAFDDNDLAFYTAVAGQLGIAMENAQLFEAERKQRRLSEALEKAAVAVSSTLDLDQVLDRILEQVAQVVPGDCFNIMLIDDGQARTVRWRGYEKLGVADEVQGYYLPISEYPHWAEMSRTGKPIVVRDMTHDGTWKLHDDWAWLRSYVGAPIRMGGATVGLLNVDGTKPGQFSSRDGHRLEAFASHAATAIENARLYERLRDHAETLEHRVAERTAELQAQYSRLEAILGSTVNGIVVTGRDGEPVLANPVAREWLTQTLSPEEASLLRSTVRDMAQRAEENPEEVLELTGLDLQLRAATIEEPGMNEEAAVVAIHDISHLKALDRMKSRFVSNVSHELRTPIATIKLFAHLMSKQPNRWREYLEPLAREAEHQADLVEDILEISRVDAGRLEISPERTNLRAVADAAIANCEARAYEQGLKLQVEPSEGTQGPISMVDRQRMGQVLDNLINNAIRYTPERGKITVSTGKAEAGGRSWATVTVADTGMGIPEDELPHVFERFFRGEKPRTLQISGTGLGLAIVQEIVGLHGGRVTVDSEVDAGSSFTVWLPLAD